MSDDTVPRSADAAPRRGGLVLVATPIGNLGDLAPRAVQALRDADAIACEDTRHTRKLLTAAGIEAKRLLAVHEHNELAAGPGIVALIDRGEQVALVTDAGMPAISDPGQRIVAAVVAAGLAVTCVPGPSAVVVALALRYAARRVPPEVLVEAWPAERRILERLVPSLQAERTP